MSLLTVGGRQPLTPAERGTLADCASKFPVAGTAPFTPAPKRYKRTLPFGAKTVTVEGIGKIATQSVGSTAYSCGYHVYLHRDEAEESACGYLAIGLHMLDDGRLEWRINHEHVFGGEGAFSLEERAAMLAAVDARKHYDEAGYMFQVHGCVEPLIRHHEGEITRQKNSIEHLTKLLNNPAEPKTIFVPKEASDTGKGYHRPRDPANPSDQAEYDEARTRWRFNRQRCEDKLEALNTGAPLLRYEMLLRLRAAWRKWSGEDRTWADPKTKARKPLVKYKLLDMLENARHPGGSVVDEINDVDD